MKKTSKLVSAILALTMAVSTFTATSVFAAIPAGMQIIDCSTGEYSNVILFPNPDNPNGAFRIETNGDYDILLPGDYVGNTTVTIKNSNPDILVMGYYDQKGDYQYVLDSSAMVRTTSTEHTVKELENGADLPEDAKFTVRAGSGEHGDGTLTITYTAASGKYAGKTYTETYYYEVVDTSEQNSQGDNNSSFQTVKCDTTTSFKLAKGKPYTFKVTSSSANITPVFTVGNGSVLKTHVSKKVGNDFYFQVIATGKPGESTGVYITIPGQTAQKQCAVTIA